MSQTGLQFALLIEGFTTLGLLSCTAVPVWGYITRNLSGSSPKRDCSPSSHEKWSVLGSAIIQDLVYRSPLSTFFLVLISNFLNFLKKVSLL